MTIEEIKTLITQAENAESYDSEIVETMRSNFVEVRGAERGKRHKSRMDTISRHIDTHPIEVVKAIKSYNSYGCVLDHFSCDRECSTRHCLIRTLQEYFYNTNCHNQRSCADD